MKRSKRGIYRIALLLLLIFLGIRYMQKDQEGSGSSESAVENTLDVPGQEEQDEIAELTAEEVVVAYVKKHGELPEYYISKKEARQKGWVAAEGNLCEVLPGKAIGGDPFGNRERRLPEKRGRRYYEADLNYACGRRGADRMIYSDDGLIFVTKDHYQTFEEK